MRPRGGLVLQNDEADPPALLGAWAEARGLPFETCFAPDGGLPVDPGDYGWIAALGSYHSVNDHGVSWIAAEVDLLERAVEASVPTLGICFGGQALAVALGAEVARVEVRRGALGWVDTRAIGPELVPSGRWLYLNVEGFSVPASAELVAESRGGPAAFRRGPHVGVQFHPEATAAMAEAWASRMPDPLSRAGLTLDRLRQDGRAHGSAAARRAFHLFDRWWALRTTPTQGVINMCKTVQRGLISGISATRPGLHQGEGEG